MIVLKKTAALVAVFFMLITGGCYTKLKHPEPVLIPDNQAISESGYDWDFSHGWRGSHWGQYDKYKGYYITQWWYDCPWRGDIIGIEKETDDYYADETIDDFIPIYIPFLPPIYNPPEYSDGIIIYSDQSGQNKKEKHSEKIDKRNTPKEKISENNKIKHRGRR
ncbi:MAG: hypothetical protein J7K40_00025 [candidate division Zixibacteria bacterium]|nr:hypothetical protein [candidate division Zixibacteria bacterium]